MTTHYLAESGGIAPKTTPCWLRNVRALIRRRMRPHLLLWAIAICLVGEQTGTAQNAATPQLEGSFDGISFYSFGFPAGAPIVQLARGLAHHQLAVSFSKHAMTVGFYNQKRAKLDIYLCANRAFFELAGQQLNITITPTSGAVWSPDRNGKSRILVPLGDTAKEHHGFAHPLMHELSHHVHFTSSWNGTPFWFSEGYVDRMATDYWNQSVQKKNNRLADWRRLNAIVSNANQFSIISFMDGGEAEQNAYLNQVPILINGQPVSMYDVYDNKTFPNNQGIQVANPYGVSQGTGALHYFLSESICSFFLCHPQSTRYMSSLIKASSNDGVNLKTPANKFAAQLRQTWSPQGNGVADFEKGWRVWLAYLGASGDPDPTLNKAYWAINPGLAQQYGLEPPVNWDAEIAAANADLQDILNGNPPAEVLAQQRQFHRLLVRRFTVEQVREQAKLSLDINFVNAKIGQMSAELTAAAEEEKQLIAKERDLRDRFKADGFSDDEIKAKVPRRPSLHAILGLQANNVPISQLKNPKFPRPPALPEAP